MEDLYVDGVGNIMSGPAITKLDCYSVESITKKNDGKQQENRKKIISVVMPTISYLAFLKNSINHVKNNKEGFYNESLLIEIKNTIDNILSDGK